MYEPGNRAEADTDDESSQNPVKRLKGRGRAGDALKTGQVAAQVAEAQSKKSKTKKPVEVGRVRVGPTVGKTGPALLKLNPQKYKLKIGRTSSEVMKTLSVEKMVKKSAQNAIRVSNVIKTSGFNYLFI